MKILKFGKPGCPGCKVMVPRFEEIEKENPELETVMFNIEEDKKEIEKYAIEHTPTFIFVDKDHKELERLIDIQPKEKILELIKKYQDK